MSIQWIPGHQAIEGNVRAHTLTRDEPSPGPSEVWPDQYDPRYHRKLLHKDRTALLRERRQAMTQFPFPPASFSREDASILRRAQTSSLLTPHFIHYMQGRAGFPSCPHCQDYPSNVHMLWHCPHAQSSLTSLLSTLPPSSRPPDWAGWLAPPPQLVGTLLPLLVEHVRAVLGDQ